MMGPVEEKVELESDEEIPFSSTPVERKVHAFGCEATQMYSRGHFAYSWTLKQMRMGPPSSVYIVILKSKINVLLPFGPIAILLHYLTRKHVRTCHIC